MSGTRYSPLAALAASPARPRAYDVMPEALIPPGTVTAQNQSAEFPLDPISEMPLLRQAGVTQGEEQRMMDNAVTAAGFSGGIRAFHGSPHAFERFDSSRIGTGEGAQVYGRGLYFAEAEPVAESYSGAREWNYGRQRAEALANREMARQGTRYEDPLTNARAWFWEQAALGRSPRTLVSEALAAPNEWPELAQYVRTLDLNRFRRVGGNLYEVDINTDPARMLNWDAPANVQPAQVQGVIQRHGIPVIEPTSGREALEEFLATPYAQQFRDTGDVRTARRILTEGDASEMADWFARAQRPGSTYMNTVTQTGGGRLYGRLADTLGSPEAASETLLRADVPGVRYLDQLSRGANVGASTNNYVVFDDSLIDILRRYGILGTLAGGGAAAGASQDGTQ